MPIDRAASYEMFSTFDYVETANHIEQRPVTTVPNQALFLLNSNLVHEQARRLIEQLPNLDHQVPNSDLGSVISDLFERLYGRNASGDETSRAITFLEQTQLALSQVTDDRERRLQSWAALCRTLIAGNEFMYVE